MPLFYLIKDKKKTKAISNDQEKRCQSGSDEIKYIKYVGSNKLLFIDNKDEVYILNLIKKEYTPLGCRSPNNSIYRKW